MFVDFNDNIRMMNQKALAKEKGTFKKKLKIQQKQNLPQTQCSTNQRKKEKKKTNRYHTQKKS